MTWLTAPVLLSAALSGLAVVALTLIADRLGGTIGGLLATAPVTTTAGFLFLAGDLGNAELGARIPAGSAALFAAVLAMPAYFYAVKWTKSNSVALRIPFGLIVYVGLFTIVTLLLSRWTPERLQLVWLPATVLLVGLYWATFMQVRIEPRLLRGPKPPLTFVEGLLRFAAGVAIILLIAWVRSINDTMSTAWAVFPGTFLVTLAVMGFGNGAAFSGRAAQAGALGGIPLAFFLFFVQLAAPWMAGLWWTACVLAAAWGLYFVVLVPLFRLRKATLHY
ncbi:MAG: hypothetical protein ACPGQL_03595 [Thermoplasmatota archaeon]